MLAYSYGGPQRRPAGALQGTLPQRPPKRRRPPLICIALTRRGPRSSSERGPIWLRPDLQREAKRGDRSTAPRQQLETTNVPLDQHRKTEAGCRSLFLPLGTKLTLGSSGLMTKGTDHDHFTKLEMLHEMPIVRPNRRTDPIARWLGPAASLSPPDWLSGRLSNAR
ncbi:hypothetical protein BQ8482_90008 [Mesorhizobium delmotii]|uniref:Uncharacterized protein n=1 Tax=Mesorhizobium delmotii TaxID=1631247 RepID=A0A2P9AWZ3_9HYPH|nr:hypothetical protein BQ8482_90008 [Mesorhizobium delmotii]